jgi:hypothetical protein
MVSLGFRRCLIVLVLGGCTTDEGATRPVQSAHDQPPPAIASASAVGTVSPPSPASAAEPKHPLLGSSEPVDCGPPLPNPHGFEHEYLRRDGSCKPCERAPPTLPLCSPSERTAITRSKDLSPHHGKLVRLEGSLKLQEVICTRRGGRCGCNNRCGAPLLLTRPVDKSLEIFLSSQGEYMGCGGDEGSVCCPFELDRSTRSLQVVASGIWLDPLETPPDEDPPPGARLQVEKLCRLK